MKNEYGGSPPKIFLGAPTASVTRLGGGKGGKLIYR